MAVVVRKFLDCGVLQNGLARLVAHVPRKGEILVRYYGAYSVRRRAAWRREGIGARLPGGRRGEREEAPEPVPERVRARRKRWAGLLRRIWNVDALRCARCGGPMRVVAFTLDPGAIRDTLAAFRRKGIDPRSGWEGASRSRAPPLPRTE